MKHKILLCLVLFTFGFTTTNEDDPKMVLFLGDSLAAGYGLQASQAFPALIQQKIDGLDWNFKVINAGLSGDTSAGGLRRIDWLLRGRVDVLVLELGGNDGLRGIDLASTRANLQGIIDKVKAKNPRVKIVIAGMMVPPNLGQDYTRRFQQMYPELARANQAVLIPFLLEGVAGDTKLNLPDGIHPTAEGHKLVAETVWKHLRPVLQELR
jgi:acyl-CoA thioesterase I